MVNDIFVSAHFKLREFQSRDTETVKIDPSLLSLLEAIRFALLSPIIITSGFRTPEHNKVVGGAPASLHMAGQAADIRSPARAPADIVRAAIAAGAGGVFLYGPAGHIHVDVRLVKTAGAKDDDFLGVSDVLAAAGYRIV